MAPQRSRHSSWATATRPWSRPSPSRRARCRSSMSFASSRRPRLELAAELVAASPGMAMAHFTPGGAEADEVAIKMARQYHALRGEPYRMKVITRQGAFHGVTAGAMALDGNYFASRNVVYDGGLSWGRIAPAGACEQCDFGKASRHLACVHKIEATIRAEGPETVAAVVVDPCATAIAVSVPPVGYLRDLRSRLRPLRRPPGRRRDHHRYGSHGPLVRDRMGRHHARLHHHVQGAQFRLRADRCRAHRASRPGHLHRA